jgi:hypothetical protein
VVRRIDAWTVFKLSLLFYFCFFLAVFVAGVILWNLAESFGVLTHMTKVMTTLFDLKSFTFKARVIAEGGAVVCIVLMLVCTFLNVLMALIYNLASDVVGGVQMILLEEGPD